MKPCDRSRDWTSPELARGHQIATVPGAGRPGRWCAAGDRPNLRGRSPAPVGLGRRAALKAQVFGATALALAIVVLPVVAKTPVDEDQGELMSLSLEDLMNVEFYSASKKLENLSGAAAAVFVITQDDIRRTGVTSIPEALRMVPGLQVARADLHQWAISARGFNSVVADKLLVLIDGRTVYSPLFSGVFWDLQDTLLEDVERIEVIRGPGAALWGANAVNGVINIITRSAHDTHGGLATAGSGSLERAFGAFRYGGAINDRASYRFFLKGFDRDELPSLTQVRAASDWRSTRGGFRLDWDAEKAGSFALFGEAYDGSVEEPVRAVQLAPPYVQIERRDRDFTGGFVMARWSKETDQGHDVSFQMYYDEVDLDSAIGKYTRDTVDVEYQHGLPIGERADLLWGLAYRSNSDDGTNTFTVDWGPSRRSELWSAFAQADVGFANDRFKLTLGSKFEHNDFTGSEVQPSIRFRWTPDDRKNVWAAVSRAVQTPVRAFTDVRFNQFAGPLPQPIPLPTGQTVDTFLVSALPNTELESEELIAYEAGFRIRANRSLYLDSAVFYNVYDRLKSSVPQQPVLEFVPQPPHLLNAIQSANGRRGETHGLEILADWTPVERFQLQMWYAYVDMQIRARPGFDPSAGEGNEGQTPNHQASLRSTWDVGNHLELDAWLRYTGDLPSHPVPSYLELDLHVGWQLSDSLELSLVGRNLLNDRHAEFTNLVVPGEPSEIERSVHAKVTWNF